MFYARYVALCQKKGVSPSKVAHECGFNKGSVSVWKKKYEKGEDIKPVPDILIKLADYFGVTVDYLLGKTDDKKPPTSDTETWTVYNFEGNGTHTTTVNPNNITALKKLLDAAGDLTPEQIEALIKVAETMK